MRDSVTGFISLTTNVMNWNTAATTWTMSLVFCFTLFVQCGATSVLQQCCDKDRAKIVCQHMYTWKLTSTTSSMKIGIKGLVKGHHMP